MTKLKYSRVYSLNPLCHGAIDGSCVNFSEKKNFKLTKSWVCLTQKKKKNNNKKTKSLTLFYKKNDKKWHVERGVQTITLQEINLAYCLDSFHECGQLKLKLTFEFAA